MKTTSTTPKAPRTKKAPKVTTPTQVAPPVPAEPKKTIDDLNLTPMQKQVVESLIDLLYAEPGFTDVDSEDLINATGINKFSIGGVIGSLCKKDIIGVNIMKTNGRTMYLICLTEPFYYLHPTWSIQ